MADTSNREYDALNALAFWISIAALNGAKVPNDLLLWSVARISEDKRVAVEVTREVLKSDEDYRKLKLIIEE